MKMYAHFATFSLIIDICLPDLYESQNSHYWHRGYSKKRCVQSIPDICHLNHLYIGGEKSVMWRNFRFQCMTDVEKFEISPHAEEFQLFPHNRCGKMWNFAKFGGILHISTWQMWRNPKFTLFCCCKICFVTNYAVFAKSVLARITCFCVEKNWARWRKKLQISGMSQIHPSIPNPLIGPWWYIRLWHLLHEGKMCG